jgi:hypothetical protein
MFGRDINITRTFYVWHRAPMYRICVCDQLVFFEPCTNCWVCGAAFNDIADGISAVPARLDITEKKRAAVVRLGAELDRRGSLLGNLRHGLVLRSKACLGCALYTRATSQSRGPHINYGCVFLW